MSDYKSTAMCKNKGDRKMEDSRDEAVGTEGLADEILASCDAQSTLQKIEKMMNGAVLVNRADEMLIPVGVAFTKEGEADREHVIYTFKAVAGLELYVDEHTRELNKERARGDELQAQLNTLQAQLDSIQTTKGRRGYSPDKYEVEMIEDAFCGNTTFTHKELSALVEIPFGSLPVSNGTIKTIKKGKHVHSSEFFLENKKKALENFRLNKEDKEDKDDRERA